MESNGLVKKDTDEQGRKVRVCPRCNTKNPGSAKYCVQCSLGLDLKSFKEYEKTRNLTLDKLQDEANVEAFLELVSKKFGLKIIDNK